jgi:Zn-dependent protease
MSTPDPSAQERLESPSGASSPREHDPMARVEPALAPTRPRWWLHVALFVATAVTTTLVGLEMALGRQAAGDAPSGPGLGFWLDGLSYSLSILAILMAHEMGHYVTARRRGIDASPPYFLPMISAFGTFGAFIRMRVERQVPSDHLMRVAAYGPLAGFAVALPVLLVGMSWSDVRPAPDGIETEGIVLGSSVLMFAAEALFHADRAPGMEVWLHPMAFAGWAGLFVTALNLLPIGQLDGGHIAYCLFGERFNRVMPALFWVLLAMTFFVFSGWLMLCLLLLLIGFRHPPMCHDLPVRGRARWIGWGTLALFVLCFTPIPFGGMPTLFELLTR